MSRFGNRTSAASILQRAQSQLQGKRVPVGSQAKSEEDDLGAYLNTLTLKTGVQKTAADSKDDVEISDISMSSNDMVVKPKYSAEASRFIKKKKSSSDTNVRGLSKSMDATPSYRKPTSQPLVGRSANFSGSSALSKAAELGRKFESKKKGLEYHSKHLDKEASISDDDFGKGGSRFLKKKSNVETSPKGSKRGHLTSTPNQTQKRVPSFRSSGFGISVSDSDEEFMKNLTPISSPEVPPIRDISDLEPVARPKSKPMNKQAKKKDRRKSPSPSRRSPSPILKRRTPSPPLRLYRHESIMADSDASVVEEVELQPSYSVHDSTISEETFAGAQVLGIEQLKGFSPEPEVRFDPTPRMISPEEISDTDSYDRRKAERRHLKRQSSRERYKKDQSVFRAGGARSVESVGSVDQTSEIESEILTQRSISEIKTRSILSTPRSDRYAKSVSIQSEDTYTHDFESDSGKSYSDTFETDRTGSPRGRRSPESKRAAYRNKKRSATYSEDFESYQTDSDVTIDLPEDDSETVSYSESFTSYTDSRTITRSTSPYKKKAKKRNQNTRDMAVQADDVLLSYQWRTDAGTAVFGPAFGLNYVDPTPIASHVINPDAVEALTSYSPSVLALNDMLRSQIQITQQFILNSRQIHNSYAHAVDSDYNYVTLEDTKAFLHKHRKPRLTFEEALRQVKEEMGMATK